MKLTFITDTMSSGGAERVISVLANYFSEKYNVEIVCLSGNKSFYPLKEAVTLTYLEVLYGKNLAKKFHWFVKNIKSDTLVIAFMVNVYIFTLTALFFKQVKIIVSERNDPRFHSLPIRILRRILIRRTQRLVVQTRDIANYFPKKLQDKIDIVYNPISSNYSWRSAISSDKENVIVTVGRLSPQKNHKMLINAFSVVHKQHPEYQLHIYGDGEIREETERYIHDKGLDECVLLKGKSNDLANILPHAQVFAMSSDYEGMSNSLIEAMYIGLPVLTTAVSGTKELIKNGENGFVVPVRDEIAFTELLLKLVEDKELRNRISEKGINIKNKISQSAILNKWETIINIVSRC